MVMEPVEKVTFGARVAKEQGILRLAQQSLHIEIPAHRVFHDPRTQHAYTEILAELLNRVAAVGPVSAVTRAAPPSSNGAAE